MFIAALFTIARTWKQPKCPSSDEWIKKISYIHTHTHTKRNMSQPYKRIKSWDNMNGPRGYYAK